MEQVLRWGSRMLSEYHWGVFTRTQQSQLDSTMESICQPRLTTAPGASSVPPVPWQPLNRKSRALPRSARDEKYLSVTEFNPNKLRYHWIPLSWPGHTKSELPASVTMVTKGRNSEKLKENLKSYSAHETCEPNSIGYSSSLSECWWQPGLGSGRGTGEKWVALGHISETVTYRTLWWNGLQKDGSYG